MVIFPEVSGASVVWGFVVGKKAVQSVTGLFTAAARMPTLVVWLSVNASIATRLPPINSPQTPSPTGLEGVCQALWAAALRTRCFIIQS